MNRRNQPGILQEVPSAARYVTFRIQPGVTARQVIRAIRALEVSEAMVLGLGPSAVASIGANVPGLRPFPRLSGPGADMPSTEGALWIWFRGDDRGDLVHAARAAGQQLQPAFSALETIDGFRHGSGLDLTGFEDGTENPAGAKARSVALVQGRGAGLDGSSFVAVQRWVHDLTRFDAMSAGERDMAIGRRRDGNEEILDAPAFAHVKRTAQESFEPPAFVLRRSMPWTDGASSGLMFVAFGASFDPFEALCRRMIGAEDGIVDGLFRFTRPVTGNYFWCPPLLDCRLDLGALGARG
ncbi:MAG: Dyp-type peroxidase [Candidatus Wallbacteria bacterium]|nr:Dyp-type peroxidase [Candidatus Wallbacteria bacterium]